MTTKTESFQIDGHDATKTIITDDLGRIIHKTWAINEFKGFENFVYQETTVQYHDNGDKQVTLYNRGLRDDSDPYWTEITKHANGDLDKLDFEGKDKRQYFEQHLYSDDFYSYDNMKKDGYSIERTYLKGTTTQVCEEKEFFGYPYKKCYEKTEWPVEDNWYYHEERNNDFTTTFRKNVKTGEYTKTASRFGYKELWQYNNKGKLIKHNMQTIYTNNSFDKTFEYYEDNETLKSETTNNSIKEVYNRDGKIIEWHNLSAGITTRYSESNGIKQEITTQKGKVIEKVIHYAKGDRKYISAIKDDGTRTKKICRPGFSLFLKARNGHLVEVSKHDDPIGLREEKTFDDNGNLLKAEKWFGKTPDEECDNYSSYEKVFDGNSFRIETEKYDVDTKTETRCILNAHGVEVSKTIAEFNTNSWNHSRKSLREYDHSVLVKDTKYINGGNTVGEERCFDPKTGALIKHFFIDELNNKITVTWDAETNQFRKTVRQHGEIIYDGPNTQEMLLDSPHQIINYHSLGVYDIQSKDDNTFLRVNGNQHDLYLDKHMQIKLFADKDGKRRFNFSDAIKCYIFGRHCDKTGEDLSTQGCQQAKNIGILLGLMLMGRVDIANIVRPDEILCTNNPRSIRTANIIADNMVKTAGINLPNVQVLAPMTNGVRTVQEKNANLLTISSFGAGYVGDGEMGSISIAPKHNTNVYRQDLLSLNAKKIERLLAEYGIHQM